MRLALFGSWNVIEVIAVGNDSVRSTKSGNGLAIISLWGHSTSIALIFICLCVSLSLPFVEQFRRQRERGPGTSSGPQLQCSSAVCSNPLIETAPSWLVSCQLVASLWMAARGREKKHTGFLISLTLAFSPTLRRHLAINEHTDCVTRPTHARGQLHDSRTCLSNCFLPLYFSPQTSRL